MSKPTSGTFSVLIDQDVFFFSDPNLNEDRNYTQGTAFVYSNPDLMKSPFFWPLRKVEKYLEKTNRSGNPIQRMNASFGLGGTAFTPLKIDSMNPIVGDRPFAFLFYASTSAGFVKTKEFHRHGETVTRKIYNTYTMNVGLFGTNLGYQFQGFAHKYIIKGRPEDPFGWNTQISQGGSPTLLLQYNRFRPLFSVGDALFNDGDKSLLDLGWNFGGSVGYYDRVFNDLYLRLGFINKSNQACATSTKLELDS